MYLHELQSFSDEYRSMLIICNSIGTTSYDPALGSLCDVTMKAIDVRTSMIGVNTYQGEDSEPLISDALKQQHEGIATAGGVKTMSFRTSIC